jgi:hypothetical protein
MALGPGSGRGVVGRVLAHSALAKSALCVFGVVALATAAAQPPDDPRIATSREATARFQQELSGRLMAAMAAGGPVEAIAVCSEEAPAIAARLSAELGAQVGRTGLRLRSPENAPDGEERVVLEQFERAVRAGATEPPEHFAVTAAGGARYMKAILAQPPCLVCHGAAVAAPIQEALAKRYPQDRAVGFAAGDLRGAFVIEWPVGADAHLTE